VDAHHRVCFHVGYFYFPWAATGDVMLHGEDRSWGEENGFILSLQARLGSQVRHLRVVCRRNGIVLQGYARSYYAKQLAQHTLMTMTALPILANEIEVC
jgi:hypothetical protein